MQLHPSLPIGENAWKVALSANQWGGVGTTAILGFSLWHPRSLQWAVLLGHSAMKTVGCLWGASTLFSVVSSFFFVDIACFDRQCWILCFLQNCNVSRFLLIMKETQTQHTFPLKPFIIIHWGKKVTFSKTCSDCYIHPIWLILFVHLDGKLMWYKLHCSSCSLWQQTSYQELSVSVIAGLQLVWSAVLLWKTILKKVMEDCIVLYFCDSRPNFLSLENLFFWLQVPALLTWAMSILYSVLHLNWLLFK